eukprot:TRINITY_DN1545_c0_g1_i2.p1 TRINITY_DN1545_c0_g1~~TRINITY_DN1545_c0_g1_i2.p1  ORF type:complete len:353 (-),score=39.60 TRINITY_DN1545_c0_g1_i2:79-1137(-)
MDQIIRAKPVAHGDLSSWAEMGVLLLNLRLTTSTDPTVSEINASWISFARAVLTALLSQTDQPRAFLAWGTEPNDELSTISASIPNREASAVRLLFSDCAPSDPQFIHCTHFHDANVYLNERQLAPLNWALPNLSKGIKRKEVARGNNEAPPTKRYRGSDETGEKNYEAGGERKIVCYACKEEGHFANNCPSRGNGGGRGNVEGGPGRFGACYKCGEEGHWSNNCPQNQASGRGGGGGGGRGGSCYSCGEEGHWSNNCPKKNSSGSRYGGASGSAGGYSRGGGGSSSSRSGACYKCGEEGHWSNNCPKNNSGGGGYGRGGGYSGGRGGGSSSRSGACYKCGQEGHWANNCPG